MAKFHLKCAADGTHELHGQSGRVGEIDEKELRDYARAKLGMRHGESVSPEVSERLSVALGSGSGGARDLHYLVKERRQRDQCSEDVALSRVLLTEAGKAAWERKRSEELTLSDTLSHFTQDKRD